MSAIRQPLRGQSIEDWVRVQLLPALALDEAARDAAIARATVEAKRYAFLAGAD